MNPTETAVAAAPARPSPNARPGPSPLGALARHVVAELVAGLRQPGFVVGTVIFPALLFTLFGLPNAGQALPGGLDVGGFLLASFAAYGMLGIAIFSFGVGVAAERGRGWTRTLRATPMPAWRYFAAKVVVAALFGVLVLGVLFAVGVLLADVRFSVEVWLRLSAALLLGSLPFSTLGFALGYWASPTSAGPIANLVYLPLAFASGLFVPLAQLPAVLRELAPWLPTYHYGQLVWGALAAPSDVELLTGIAPAGAPAHLAWLVGAFALFGALAVWGYRRDRTREPG